MERRRPLVPFFASLGRASRCGCTVGPGRTLHPAMSAFLASLFLLFHGTRLVRTNTAEDAFIFYRYAVHLAQGDGFVWNRGEAPVEGFTSLLHVLLLAAGAWLGGDLLVVGRAVGLAGGVATCAGSAWLAYEVAGRDSRAAVIAPWFVACCSMVAVWTAGGFETTTFAALLTTATAAWLHESSARADGENPPKPRRRLSVLLLLLAVMSRPEGLALAVVLIAVDGVVAWREGRGRAAARIWASYAPLFIGFVALVVWKLLTFGSVVPNCAQAKLTASPEAVRAGATYVAGALRTFGYLPLLLAVFGLFHPSAQGTRLLGFLFVGFTGWVLATGGDFYVAGRYVVPFLPFACVLAAVGVSVIDRKLAGVPRLVVPCVWAACAVVAVELLWPSLVGVASDPSRLTQTLRPDTTATFSNEYREMARVLERVVPPGSTVAALPVGALGYYLDRPVLDLLGLNDRRIARIPVPLGRHARYLPGHMRGDAAELLARRPEFVVLQVRALADPGTGADPETRATYPFVDELLRSPTFTATYQLESHALATGWLDVFRKRERVLASCGARSLQDHANRNTPYCFVQSGE